MRRFYGFLRPSLLLTALIASIGLSAISTQGTLTGKAALGDWTTDAPGVRRKISVADLPGPYETRAVDNGPSLVRRPQGAWPKAPAGFKVELYITGLYNPREIVTA